MNTIKKFAKWVISIITSVLSMLTLGAFTNNPRLIVEQLKRSKVKRLSQVEAALTATLTQIKSWEKSLEDMKRKKDTANAAIAKFVAANKMDKAGAQAKVHERYSTDVARMEANIAKFRANYELLLKTREDVIAAFDAKIAEAESSIASVAVSRQMIELCRLTRQTLASDGTSEIGMVSELVEALDKEQIRLESELQVRADVNAVDQEADASELTDEAALARWQSANQSAQ